jgi:hypothetical protein
LKKIFNILFTHKKLFCERNIGNVILWWEARRIPYNIFITVVGLINLFCFNFVVNGAYDFVSGLSIIGFYFMANTFYTLGWVTELIIRSFNKGFSAKISIISFKVGIILTIIACFFPTLFFGLSSIKNGVKISSPYIDFTKEKPNWIDLTGEYQLSSNSIEELNYPDSLKSKFLFKLNPDSTFVLKYFPDHSSTMELQEYDIINAKGKWRLDDDFGSSWVLPFSFEQTTNITNNNTEKTSFHNGNGFRLKGEGTPYKIYVMIGDPDSWYGITLEQIKINK